MSNIAAEFNSVCTQKPDYTMTHIFQLGDNLLTSAGATDLIKTVLDTETTSLELIDLGVGGTNELCREKTCIRYSPTQNGLYSHSRRLEL